MFEVGSNSVAEWFEAELGSEAGPEADWLDTIRCPDCGSDAVSSELAKLTRIVGVLIEAPGKAR